MSSPAVISYRSTVRKADIRNVGFRHRPCGPSGSRHFVHIRSEIAVFAGRFNADGSVDDGGDGDSTPGNEFGDGGKVLTTIGSSDSWASIVAIQADDKIVVAGSARNLDNDYVVALAQYNSNGSLDGTFDADGVLTTDFGSSGAYADCVASAPDGKIVVAGKSYVLDVGTDGRMPLMDVNISRRLFGALD